MLKILLVDDEVGICHGMKKLISRADSDYFLVAEAYDGVEALDVMEQFNPDVLLTDVIMPRMDGMQLLREAKSRKPDLLTAVVSAYSDYDYIREAMLLHASDYLLKPVTAGSLQELLQRLRHKYEQLLFNREHKALNDLLKGIRTEAYPESLHYEHYTLALACAGPYNRVTNDCPGEAFWQSSYFADSLERLKADDVRHWILNGERSNERLVLFAANRKDADLHIRACLNGLLRSLPSPDIPVTLVAETGLSLQQLAAAAKLLRRELLQSLVYAKSSLLGSYGDPSDRGSDADRTFTLETSGVIEAVEQQRYELFEGGLNALIASWEKREATQFVIHQTLFRVLAALGERGLEKQIDLEMLVSRSLDYSELRIRISAFFASLLESCTPAEKSSVGSAIVAQIEQYLRKNFRESITLQSLSQEFGLVPNYLSVIFKREHGVTPNEYLMEFRIKEAKRLLDDQPQLLLKQVAGEVGYSDQLYFSRVFKKLTGQSPSEYVQSRHP